VERRDPAYGLASSAVTVRYLRGIHDEAGSVPRPDRLQPRTRGFARIGGLIPEALLRRARADEAAHAARINEVLADHDVLVTPVTATPPVAAAQWEGSGATRTLLGMIAAYPFAAVWNMTGQPAAAVPAGFSADGLPLAVQLVGRPGDEATLLSLAAQLEAERPWADRRPPVS
jgi:amidase